MRFSVLSGESSTQGGHRQSNISGAREVKEGIGLPDWQINDPQTGWHSFHLFLSATPSSWTMTFEGPSILPCALVSELHKYKDTFCGFMLGMEVPGHCQEQLTQTLIVCLLKMHLFSSIQKFRSLGPPCPTVCLLAVVVIIVERVGALARCLVRM